MPDVAPDVAMFRGNAALTGEMPGPGPDGKISVLWQFATGAWVWSSPAVVGGAVYAGSSDRNVYSIDAATGSERWRFATGGGVASSPAVVDAVVYVGSEDGNLYAIDAATGIERWRFATGTFVNSSPVVVDGVVYFGSADKNVYALDVATGSERWRFATGAVVFSSPAVVDGVVYVGSNDRNMYAIDAATGSERWRVRSGAFSTSSSPAVVGGVVYVGSSDHIIDAIDATTGSQRWRFGTPGKVGSSPAVVDDVVYAVSVDNLYAIDATTGSERWRFSTGRFTSSSPAVVGGVVYLGGSDRKFYAIDAATGGQRWQFGTGGGVGSSPAVVGGVVYVGSSDGKVYALIGSTSRVALSEQQTFFDDVAFNLAWHAKNSSDVPPGLTISAGGQGAHLKWLPLNAAAVRTWPVTRGRGGSGEAEVSALIYCEHAEAGRETQTVVDGLMRQGWVTATTDRVAAGDPCLTYSDASGAQAVCYAVRGRLVIVGVSALPVDNVDAVLMNAADLVRLGVAATLTLELPELTRHNDTWNQTVTRAHRAPRRPTNATPVTSRASAGGSTMDGEIVLRMDGGEVFAKSGTGLDCGGDVPMFHCNAARTGEMPGPDSDGEISVLWQFATGDVVECSPIVSDLVVYIGSADGKVFAIDVMTGSELWRFVTGDRVNSSPAVVDGVIYVGSVDHNVYAIDATTGKERWRFATDGWVIPAPAVVDGVVYVGSWDNNLYAIDAASGTERWRYATGAPLKSSAAVVDGVVYTDGRYGEFYALDAATGSERWRFATGSIWGFSTPAVVAGVVYFGSFDCSVYALDAGTGRERWRFVTGGQVGSSPALADGVVYVGCQNHNVYAIDAATGRERWRFATGGQVGSSPALVNGVVFVGSDDGNLYAIDAATGKERWRFATGGGVGSSPAVADGVVYFGSNDGCVYAIAYSSWTKKLLSRRSFFRDTTRHMAWLAENSSDVPRGLRIGAGGPRAADPWLPWYAAVARTWPVTLGRGGSGEAAVSALIYDAPTAASSETQGAIDGLMRRGWAAAATDRVAADDTCLTYRDASGAQAVCYAVRGRLVIVGVSALPVDNVDAVLMNAADLVRLGVAATQDLTLPE